MMKILSMNSSIKHEFAKYNILNEKGGRRTRTARFFWWEGCMDGRDKGRQLMRCCRENEELWNFGVIHF